MIRGFSRLFLAATLVLAACDAGPDAARFVSQRFPAHAARVLETPAWSAVDDGFVVPEARALAVKLPDRGADAIVFSQPGFEATVHEREARGAAVQAGGAVSWARAGGRSYWVAHPGGAEEWLAVDVAQPGRVAAWDVEGATLREAGAEVELLDSAGEPRMRVTAPEAYSADGHAIDVRLVVADRSIELWTTATGLLLIDPAWISANSLATARTFHTATLLPNGLVLVAGGCTSCTNGTGSVATAELFDPAKARWTGAGAMVGARAGHTATLLPNGKVLLAGGWNNGGVSTAELYDPATNTFAATGAMASAHRWATATLLSSGKVLVAGGTNGTAAIATAELYDPATGTWSAVGSLASPRYGAAAALLPSGKVLITGGYAGSTTWNTAELFDPATNTFSSGGTMAGQRFAHTATLLPNGRVLVAGGWVSGTYLSSCELYDPATNAWSLTGSMTVVRERHTATLLPNGRVLVTGGNDVVSWNPLPGAETYDPATGSWSQIGTLTTPRWNHVATLLPNDTVLLTGGSTTAFNVGIANVETLNALSPAFSGTGVSTVARTDHTSTLLPDGTVLVAGGTSGGGALAGAELYDPNTGKSTATGTMATARSGATATLLPTGNVLVAGGTSAGGSLSRAEIFTPANGKWMAAGSLGTARAYHTATLLPSGLVLVTGGTGSSGALASAELYSLATGAWIPAGNMAIPRTGHRATLLPSGLVLITGGATNASAEVFNPATNAFTSAGNMTAIRKHHTATLLPNGNVLITGGDNGAALASAEIYSGTFAATGAMSTARTGHTATLLVSGRVLVTGAGTAELYDPATGAFASAGTMATARTGHTATLLANGKVYFAGGSANTSAELHDEGRGAPTSSMPVVNAPTATWAPGGAATLTGTLFTGLGESAAGGPQASPTNWPMIVFEREDSGSVTLANATSWKATSASVTMPGTIQPGWLWIRVIVNGIPSVAKPLFVPSGTTPLTISPTSVNLSPRGPQAFTARGGSGTYGWSISPNASNASISATGAYVAGTTCNVTDVVTVTDTYGRTASATVNVGACLAVSPANANVPPRGTQQLTATGGNGTYTWTVVTNNSNGTVSPAGTYVAGATCNVTDTVRVTDSLGNTASATIHVGACLTVDPPTASVPPRGGRRFTASGGSGTGYVWTVSNGSGGTVNGGVYVAGAGCGTTDTVTVTDSLGNTASATITVGACLTIDPASPTVPPRGTQDFHASGGSGTGYEFSVTSDDPDAKITPDSGHFQAGAGCLLKALVTVKDSLGNTAFARVTISECLQISPATATTPPRGRVAFTATGGSGTGYAYALTTNASGGTVDPATGAYVAGPTGNVTDVVTVTDSLGNSSSANVSVGAGLVVEPDPAMVPPRGSQDFTVKGGSGEGFTWTLERSPSGGTIDEAGHYTAGKNGSVVDTVTVTDSLGNTASTTVNVGPEVTIDPDTSSIEAGTKIGFIAHGGSGTGWQWTITQNNTQGAIDPETGAYEAGLDGPAGDTTDIVRVTDSLGNTGTAVVSVRTKLRLVADGCDCACSSASNGMLAILGFLALWPRRRRVV